MPTCARGGFAYSGNPTGPMPGQPFTVAATAKSASSASTANYYNAGGYAKSVNLSVSSGGATGQLYVDTAAGGTGAVPAAKFLNLNPGEGKVNYFDATGKISFVFNVLPHAEQALQIHAKDADTVASAGANGDIAIRHGRLRMFNVFGSEKANLSLPLRAEYWTGNSWILNNADSFTVIPAASIALSAYTGTLSDPANFGAGHIAGTTLGGGNKAASYWPSRFRRPRAASIWRSISAPALPTSRVWAHIRALPAPRSLGCVRSTEIAR